MASPKPEWNEQRVVDLITNQADERVDLEFKAAGALDGSDSKKKEISKDISAMANSAGGTVIYGVEEDGKGVAASIDGIDPAKFSKDWLDQVITSRIQPRLSDVEIHEVRLDKSVPGRVAYVVAIPQATTFAPHQASDSRYHKRSNTTTAVMEDYEIRDALLRTRGPDLRCNLHLSNGIPVQFTEGNDASNALEFDLDVFNDSVEPATHAAFQLFIDTRLKPGIINYFSSLRNWGSIEVGGDYYQVGMAELHWTEVSSTPIYHGIKFDVSDGLGVRIPLSDIDKRVEYLIAVEVFAPYMLNRMSMYVVQYDNKVAKLISVEQ